jgi:protein TonB
MKPEAIMQSDMLDILFENRNKEYGAYHLRKNYNKRLLQALCTMCLLVSVFILLQSATSRQELKISGPSDPLQLISVTLPPDEKKLVKPASIQKAKVHATVNDTKPRIVDDHKIVDTKMPTVDELDQGNLGTQTKPGPPITDPGPPAKQPVGQTNPEPVSEPVLTGPLDYAEVMPSFYGDLKKFMLRNLPQPDDIPEGEKIMVRVKFVVTAEGEVTNVELIQSGRSDLDEQVIRVIRKMPRWKPGMQGGRAVPVYFHLPVTFVSNSE